MERKDKYFILIISTFVCLIFFWGRLTSQNLLLYFGSLLSALICLFSKNNYLFLCVLLPNTYYCMIGDNAICGYLSLLIIAAHFLNGSFKIDWNFFVGVAFFGLSFIISMFVTNNFSLFMTIVKTISMCLMFYFVFQKIKDKAKKRNMISNLAFCYIYGAFIFSVLGIIFYLIQKKSILAFDIYSTRFSGLATDPNYMSAILCLAIALVFVEFIIFKQLKKFFVIAAVTFVLSGLVSLSRGFMLTLVIIFAMFVLDVLLSRDFSSKTKFAYLVGTVFVVALVFIFGREPIAMVLMRSEDAIYAGGSGRTELWLWYIKDVFSSPLSALVGKGSAWGSISSGLVNNVEHNTFIQLVFQTGIIGSFCYFLFFYKLSKVMGEDFRLRIGLMIPITATVIPYSLLSAINGENFIFAMIISMVFLLYPLKSNRKVLVTNGALCKVQRSDAGL